MPEQIRKAVPKTSQADAEALAAEDAATQAAQEKAAADLTDTDDLLDEIDALLEDQEVLVNFRQKGGE